MSPSEHVNRKLKSGTDPRLRSSCSVKGFGCRKWCLNCCPECLPQDGRYITDMWNMFPNISVQSYEFSFEIFLYLHLWNWHSLLSLSLKYVLIFLIMSFWSLSRLEEYLVLNTKGFFFLVKRELIVQDTSPFTVFLLTSLVSYWFCSKICLFQ